MKKFLIIVILIFACFASHSNEKEEGHKTDEELFGEDKSNKKTEEIDDISKTFSVRGWYKWSDYPDHELHLDYIINPKFSVGIGYFYSEEWGRGSKLEELNQLKGYGFEGTWYFDKGIYKSGMLCTLRVLYAKRKPKSDAEVAEIQRGNGNIAGNTTTQRRRIYFESFFGYQFIYKETFFLALKAGLGYSEGNPKGQYMYYLSSEGTIGILF